MRKKDYPDLYKRKKPTFRYRSPMICLVLFLSALFFFCHGCSQPLQNLSPGKISLVQGPALAGHFHSLASGDLNNDGHPDLVAGNYMPNGHDIVIWHGDGLGGWQKMVKLPVYGSVHSLGVGDINHDGLKDICLTVWEGREGIAVWLNQGDDIWLPAKSPTRSGLYDGLLVQDVSSDQVPDLLSANYSLEGGRPGGIHVWLADHKGDWSDNIGPIAEGRFANITLADFNLDGLPDIAGASWGPDGAIMIWLARKGKQNWATMPPLDKGNFWGIKATDMNQDGVPDLIVSTYNSGIRIYYGDGTGLFSPPQSLIDEGHFWDILTHDLNKDGWPDVMASSFDNHGIHIWINNGKCQRSDYKRWVNEHGDMKVRICEWETLEGLLPNFGSFYDMLLEDFDRNGHMDLAVAQRGQGVKIWLNFTNSDQIAGKIMGSDTDPNQSSIIEKDQEEKEEPSGKLLSNARFEKHFLNGQTKKRVQRNDKPEVNQKAEKGLNKKAMLEKKTAEPREMETEQEGSPEHRILANKLEQERENQVYRMIEGVPEYIIGPGDTVEITFWEGMDSKVYTIPVRSNGTITTPFFENFRIAGLTELEADRLLTKKMKRFMHDPRIDLRTVEFNSKKVTILGAIARLSANRGAGTYYLTGKTRILELIAKAGGPAGNADLKKVELIHGGVPQKINLYSAIFQGDLTQNVIVDKDDVIFIPKIEDTSSKVYIFGEVKSPGIYPFTGELTMLDAIAKAGGYGKDARLDSVKVVRGDISDPKVLDCNLKNIIEKGDLTENVYLLKNDLIYIPKSKIANMKLFVEKIDSLLKLVLYPVALVNTVEDPEDLELTLDIGY
ncbi:MAG: FG-GAP-like repeat-containing protein [bacterium]